MNRTTKTPTQSAEFTRCFGTYRDVSTFTKADTLVKELEARFSSRTGAMCEVSRNILTVCLMAARAHRAQFVG